MIGKGIFELEENKKKVKITFDIIELETGLMFSKKDGSKFNIDSLNNFNFKGIGRNHKLTKVKK